ncbi:PilZ domain-containing protein [Thermodesulfobacterium hydrogeniphilum]|uniref:PilZ domain-containing protein n=1 Tax=Thermodesulfobacterium hydrogeniphilum TaxID=161156 RepID=UPI0005705AB8|nr:PilZ domain-containing protein [Thermodesulfobacterium hydrogeniphilum]
MIDLRRFPRCITRLKAYFPEDNKSYEIRDISYKGCFIKTDKKISTKRLVYFEIEIPDVGLIPVYGVVIHHGTQERPGLGIEIVDIDKNMLPVWSYYLKALSYIEEAKRAYKRALEEERSEKS